MPLDSLDLDDDDAALMSRIAAGDRKAFQRFTRRHHAKFLAVARRVLGNASDAEEIVQEALLRVWEHAAEWRGSNSQVTTWLYRIVLNLAIDRTRKRSPVFVPVEDGPVMVDPTPSAHLVLEGRELESYIAKEIPELPVRQRDALALCYFEGLSCAEAAAAMKVSVSAMEALLVRARRTLRDRLTAWDSRRPCPAETSRGLANSVA
ncbi:MAG TPA: sigma-70 family RNA polymerase sigma factor [Alphaproteobacteria bacterium]|nr:sigma-70 family RNA polymerase sigma factor [Alphaproteobacteria bacterium]